MLATNGLDMLVAEIADYRETAPRIPSVRGQPAGKDLAKSLVDSVKNAVKEKPLGDLLSSTSAQWQAGLRRVAPFAGTLLSLVSDFTARIFRKPRPANAPWISPTWNA